MITILVAYDQNRVIGNKGGIPWDIPRDLQLFKKRTVNNVVIMGRNTWKSLPVRPLPGRINIVISKSMDSGREISSGGAFFNGMRPLYVKRNLEESALFARNLATKSNPQKEVFIIGGGLVYKESLEMGIVDRIIATRVKGNYEGDVYFPDLNDNWQPEKLVASYEEFDVVEFSRI
jgi:dihydrofolate reductase